MTVSTRLQAEVMSQLPYLRDASSPASVGCRCCTLSHQVVRQRRLSAGPLGREVSLHRRRGLCRRPARPLNMARTVATSWSNALEVRSCYRYGHISECDLKRVNQAVWAGVPSSRVKQQVLAYVQCRAAGKQIRVGTAMSGWYRWLWLRALLGAAAFMALIAMVLGDPKAKGFGSAIAIRVTPFLIFAGASLMLLLMGLISRGHPKSVGNIHRVPSSSMTPQELLDAKRKAAEKYSPEVLVLFARMLKESSRYITRAIEDVEVEDGCLRLKTVMEFAFNDEAVKKVREKAQSVILIPLIKLAKGATLDNLELRDSEGKHVAALLQDETYGLLAYVVDDLFRSAYINGGPASASGGKVASTRPMSSIEDSILRSLIQIVNNPERISDEDIDSAFGLFNAQAIGAPEPVNDEAAKHLRGLCEFFARNYLIIVEAELPNGSRLSMEYSKTVPLYEQSAALDTRSRVRLGLSPRSFAVPLTLPFDAPSYHFRYAPALQEAL